MWEFLLGFILGYDSGCIGFLVRLVPFCLFLATVFYLLELLFR